MKTLLLRMEPIVWLLFGAGIMVGTLLLPGYLLTVTLAGPLGLLPDGALAYDRVYGIASNPIGRLVLLALVALPLWKGAHHTRALAVDLLGHGADAPVGSLLYAIAAVGSVLGILAVLAL
ncbi:MAG: fumarate reductase subunit D [Proteobacteria bacterium]|nr:MAG: fumarate reductase subunit D [Pseudomonadota bacterium]